MRRYLENQIDTLCNLYSVYIKIIILVLTFNHTTSTQKRIGDTRIIVMIPRHDVLI